MKDERLYIVTYDIADPKRWRRVYNIIEAWLTILTS